MLVLFNKPFNVLCQFTDKSGRRTLSHFISIQNIYAAGRLDYDSEGLVILTDDGGIQSRISEPNNKIQKKYWVQVEGIPDEAAINMLRTGIKLKDGMTKPADAELIEEPEVWERVPSIRERKNVRTSWIALTLTEGRNRQVRRMTAAAGYPTLRLIRYSIGNWNIEGLAPGKLKIIK